MIPTGVEGSPESDINVVLEGGGGYFGRSINNDSKVVEEAYEGVMASGNYKVGRNVYAPGDEIIEKRTENGKTKYLGTGINGWPRFALEVSMGPVHYKDNYNDVNEQWKDIDLTIVNGVITKAPYVLTMNYDDLSLSVYDKRSGDTVNLKLIGIPPGQLKKVTPIISTGQVSFSEVLTNLDLQIVAENGRVSFKRIIKNSSVSHKATFSLSQTGNTLGVKYRASDSKNDRRNPIIVDSSLVNGVLIEEVSLTKNTDIQYPLEIDPSVDILVDQSSDDCYLNSGGFSLLSAFTSSGHIITDLSTGMRFNNVTVTKDAIINSAHITFISYGDEASNPVNTNLYGENYDSASTYSTEGDFTGRSLTAAVAWNGIVAWTDHTSYDTPSLATPVGTITSRAGWVSGNSMAFQWRNNGSSSTVRSGHSYNADTVRCPQLYIDYTVPTTPTVETHSPATSITETTAIVEGHVTADGGASVTDRGICWNTTGGPTTADSHAHNGTGTGLFTGSLTSLSGGTTYHTKAFATNSVGTAYGAEVDFLTKPAAPTGVTATDGTSVTYVNVTWTASTGATTYYVFRDAVSIDAGNVTVYSDTGAGAPTITAGTATASDGTSTTTVSCSIAGETGNNGSSHTYKVVAYNTSGNSSDSSTNTGYRGTTTLTYQWLRSAADSDAGYGAIGGATTNPYYDVGGATAPDGRYYKATVSMTGASDQNTTADRGFIGVPPTVSTVTATLVEETTASSGANVTGLSGGASPTIVGVEYGNTSGSYASNNHTHGTYPVGAYTIELSSLNSGLLYYYRGYATNTWGTGYGGEQTFLTKPIEPNTFVCSTINSTAISYTWVKGTGATYTYIRYKDGSYPNNIADGTESYNGTGTSNTQSGLTDAHTYYFRAWSWTSNTTLSQYSDANVGCFSVTGEVPTVVTQAATSVEETTAVGNGNVTAGSGNIEGVGIQYGLTTAYGSSVSSTAGLPAAPPQVISLSISSLSQGTYYYYRAYATNYIGTGYGGEGQFLTKPNPPTLLTATYINTTAIQLTWVPGTGATYTVIRHSNTTYPTDPTLGTLTTNITAPTATYTHAGLTSLETYYYSAWSWVSANTSQQFSDTYSQDSETVPTGVPTVYTNTTTGYGNDWATVAGLVTLTYPNPTLFGFQYGTTPAYGSWSNTTAVVAGGIFSQTITGLTPGASYHYRAFAENSYGIGYGADMEFSTGGTAILYESYTYGCNTTWNQNYETFTTMGSNWTTVQGQNWVAQNFTASSYHSVNQVVIWANRTATAAAGYIYVGIRDANSGSPNGPDLGTGLYAIAYVSTSGGPIEVSLENEIQLETGKNYAIVIRAPGADSTNYVGIQFNAAGGASGQMETSTDGGVSWTGSAYDFNFVIIGKPQPVYGNIEAAQTFLVGTTPHTAQRVRLILGRVGQPGNVYVSIRNYTGGVLANADLATVALNGNAITLDKAMYDCVLTPEKSLEANKSYAIVVTAPSGDRYNYVLWCADPAGGYASGTALQSIDAGITWTALAADYMFEVWGNSVLSVVNAKVFKNYLTTGDWLITSEILNVSPPYYDNNEDPSAFYIVSFMGLVGTTYASTPCELWDKSPVSIYLNPTQASLLSWGGNYKVRLSNLAGTVYSEYSLISTDWNASSLTYLDNWARLCAKDMEAYKLARTGTTVSYLTYVAGKGNCLNQDGGAIFNQAVPRLSAVRPNLFQVTSNRPDMEDTSTIPTPGATSSTRYREKLGSYLADLIDQGAAASGVKDPKTFGGLVMVAIYFLIAFGTVAVGFAWAGIIAAFPIWLMGMDYGFLDVQFSLVMLFILVILFVREFWFKGG